MKITTACPSCGARIDAPPRDEAYVFKCHYCGVNVPIEPLNKPKPLPAPQQPQIHRYEVRVQPPRIVVSGRPMWASLIWVVVVIGLAGAGAIKALLRSSGVAASFPLTVGINETVEIDDKTFTATSGTVATVGVNGKLTLKRCHLKGPVVIDTDMNAEVELDDCTIEGTSHAIDADVNSKITFDNTTATSAGSIVKGQVNPKIYVRNNSNLKSGGIAIDVGTNGEITVDGSRVEGKTAAVRGGMNLHVDATNAHLIAPHQAIEGGMNANVTNNASEITGSGPAPGATPSAPPTPKPKHH